MNKNFDFYLNYFLKDPEEFLNLLLGKALKSSPFIELSNGQSSYMYQLFVENDGSHIHPPNIQNLLEKSLLESKVAFKRLPRALILLMPRYGVRYKVFDQIYPSPTIDITDFIEDEKNKEMPCKNQK